MPSVITPRYSITPKALKLALKVIMKSIQIFNKMQVRTILYKYLNRNLDREKYTNAKNSEAVKANTRFRAVKEPTEESGLTSEKNVESSAHAQKAARPKSPIGRVAL